jgi:hypothetical protein
MNEGLELLKLFGFDDEQFGVTLAICARAQGSTVPAILANLQDSQERGSVQAKAVLAFYQRADEALKQMGDAARQARLHSDPGQPAGL